MVCHHLSYRRYKMNKIKVKNKVTVIESTYVLLYSSQFKISTYNFVQFCFKTASSKSVNDIMQQIAREVESIENVA